ncbi:hypothetical protein GWK47_025907 [Chionoecetes opilio]|uniref:Uncharacterized protein n=1 Tax=Chionoecetes opilio TaxID=41210 RepID=A0A8J8WLE0_CHIOP|nr:hypothetical protein GWK47_025907 [Chionoecetes opilio]
MLHLSFRPEGAEVGDFVLVQLVFKGKRSEELVHFGPRSFPGGRRGAAVGLPEDKIALAERAPSTSQPSGMSTVSKPQQGVGGPHSQHGDHPTTSKPDQGPPSLRDLTCP